METSCVVKPAKVLITGGTGFVGRHLILRLMSMGWEVHAITRQQSLVQENLDNTEMRWHLHDGTTSSMIALISESKPNLVIHLASLFLGFHPGKTLPIPQGTITSLSR